MAWNNATQNGQFGPFGSSSTTTDQTGLGTSSSSSSSSSSAVQSAAALGALPASGGGYAIPQSGSNGSLSSTVNQTSTTPSASTPYKWNLAGSYFYSAIPQPAGDNVPALSMADGGVIPDTSSDVSVNPDMALSSVKSALAAGRQSFGLPASLSSAISGNSNPAASTSKITGTSAQSQQTTPQASQPNTQQPTQGNQSNQGNSTDQTAQSTSPNTQSFADGGNMDDPSQDAVAPPGFADGGDVGVIPGAANPDEGLLQASAAQRQAMQSMADKKAEQLGEAFEPSYDDGGNVTGGDMDDPSNQGMPSQPQDNVSQPQQGQTVPANDPRQALMRYAQGAGAIDPAVAQALQARVDPTGQMDPSQRNMLAVAAAPTQQAKFGMLQHYRQRYQALNSFARVAAEGTQARPANLAASTDAATRAFQNVPNGDSVRFTPAGPGHVAVSISSYAGKGGGKGKQRGYAAGGAVPDDTDTDTPDVGQDLENAAQPAADLEAGTDAAMTQPLPQGVLPAAASDTEQGLSNAAQAATGLESSTDQAMTQPSQTIVMSIPQYVSTLAHGLWDSFMDRPTDEALNQAASKSWAASINAPGMENDTTLPTGAELVQPELKPGMYIGRAPSLGKPINPLVTSQQPAQLLPNGQGSYGLNRGTNVGDLAKTLLNNPQSGITSMPQAIRAAQQMLVGAQSPQEQAANALEEQQRGIAQLRMNQITRDATANSPNGAETGQPSSAAPTPHPYRAPIQRQAGAPRVLETIRKTTTTRPARQVRAPRAEHPRNFQQRGARRTYPRREASMGGNTTPEALPAGGENALIAGTTYNTARGPLTWTGTGFIQP